MTDEKTAYTVQDVLHRRTKYGIVFLSRTKMCAGRTEKDVHGKSPCTLEKPAFLQRRVPKV